jgi:hypothetical protein
MSQIKGASSTKMTTLFSAIASFVGMMAAVPVSLALFSNAQPAQAMQTQSPQADGYAQYAKAYTQGYLANSEQPQTMGMGCSEPDSNTTSTPEAVATSYTQAPKTHSSAPMSHEEWTKNINNSYNDYVTTTNNTTEINTKNIASNNTIGSNNTSTSSISVKDSNGAVVSNNTSAAGSNFSSTHVNNVASNNTAIVNDSFNKDSHDKTVIVKDSGNTTQTTNNTSIINDSFNHKDKTVNVNSGNTIEDNSHHYTKIENQHSHHM